MRKRRLLKMTLAVILTFALLFSGLFVGVSSSLAANSEWMPLDPMLDKLERLEPCDIEFLVEMMGNMVEQLFTSVLENQEKNNLQLMFGLNLSGMQFAQEFDSRIYSIYGGYDGFLDAVNENPRDWLDGGHNLDYLFGQTYLSFPEGFRNQLAYKEFDLNEQITLWLRMLNLHYNSDLSIDPQGVTDIRDYITGNSTITPQDLDDCGFTLDTLQAMVDSMSLTEKEAFKTVQEKLGNILNDDPPNSNWLLEIKTDDACCTVGEPVDFTVTLKDEEGDPVPYANIAVFLVNPDIEKVYFDQQVTDGSGEISGTIVKELLDAPGAYVLNATANVVQESLGFNVSLPKPTATVTPADGATGVELNATVRATFDMDVTEEDLGGVNIKEGTSQLSGTSASLNGRVLTIAHPAFANNKTYIVTIPAESVKGDNGEYNGTISWSFTTKSAPGGNGPGGGGGGGGGILKDTTSPTVVSTDPAKGASNVTVDKVISITFSEDIQAGDKFSGISLTDKDGKSVKADAAVDSSNKKVVNVKPGSKLDYCAAYTLTVPAGAVKDPSDNALKEAYTLNFTTQPERSAFSDMSGHWATQYVTQLAGFCIISGYPDGTFKPDNQVSRADFAVMITKALNLAPGSEQDLKFSDTASIPSYAKGAVAAAVKEGLLKGYPQTDGSMLFDPLKPVRRVEMAAILGRVLEMKLGTITPAELKFTDAGDIPSWAKKEVGIAVAKNVISGYPDNTFQGEKVVTRAEAATAVSKLLDITTKTSN